MHQRICSLHRRRGISSVEIVVSAGLLVALIGVLAPVAVRLRRIESDAIQYRAALADLTQQLDELSMLAPSECQQALEHLQAGDAVRRFNPDTKLTGRIIRDVDGIRAELSLFWNRDPSARPISLVAWLDSEPSEADENLQSVPTGVLP